MPLDIDQTGKKKTGTIGPGDRGQPRPGPCRKTKKARHGAGLLPAEPRLRRICRERAKVLLGDLGKDADRVYHPAGGKAIDG